MTYQRPCLECGTLSPATRCQPCRSRKEATRPRAHYGAGYASRAKKVREGASVCWLCGDGPKPGDPWQADHVYPGEVGSPLLPAHRSCNIRRHHGIPPRS